MLDAANSRLRAEFSLVGVGAAAAFSELLRGLPPDTGLGFLLIQHVDSTDPSLLGEALGKATAMPVRQAEHGTQVEPNHVYVIAPNTEMAFHDGQLTLSPRRIEGAEPQASTARRHTAWLEHELAATKEYSHTLIEEHGLVRDELQSIIEELTTRNDELQRRNHELKQLDAEAQEARVQAERAICTRDDLLATLSHQLRNPLSSMLLNVQRLLGGDVLDRADLQRMGESLERATRKQVKLVDDLLDVWRVVAGKLTLDRCPMDLGRVVRGALDSVSPLIDAKSLALGVSLDPELEDIFADPGRVHQVVLNLLSNAIKFTPRSGQLTVAVDVDAAAGFARLRVTDTGIGIQAADLPQVFARFSRSDGSITRQYGGLGVGLAIVRHVVELQGGSVRAESDGQGQGATFSVTFPLARNRPPSN